MVKYLNIIQTDSKFNIVSHALDLASLFSNYESKQLIIKEIYYHESLAIKWNLEDGIILVHSFKAWPEEQWKKFLDNVTVPLFVIPTEFDVDKLSVFKHEKISKVIVCTEYYQKYFLKTLKIDTNKVKLIYLFEDEQLLDNKKLNNTNHSNTNGKVVKSSGPIVILSPGLLTEDKDYETLFKAVKLLKYQYDDFIFALYLKSHPRLDEIKKREILANIYAQAQIYNLGKNIRILLDIQNPYDSYFKIADMVVLPIEENNDMYSKTIIDTIMFGKPLIVPDTNKLAYDLCKREAGIFLYQTMENFENPEIEKELEPKDNIYNDIIYTELVDKKDNILNEDLSEEIINFNGKSLAKINKLDIANSISENCSIIINNHDIKNIMEQQNKIVAESHQRPKILQQYINLIKRYKS